jgi:hypothetical protein
MKSSRPTPERARRVAVALENPSSSTVTGCSAPRQATFVR